MALFCQHCIWHLRAFVKLWHSDQPLHFAMQTGSCTYNHIWCYFSVCTSPVCY